MFNFFDLQFIKKDSYVLGLSLFEEQIVRSLLLSDDFNFLKQLASQHSVIIFTNYEIGHFLDTKIDELHIDNVKVTKINPIKESFVVRVVSFCLKWSDSSSATMKNLHREKISKRIGIFGYWLRKFFFSCFSNSISFKKILRQLLFLAYNLDDVKNSSLLPLPHIEIFLVTALTNSESDLPLSIYFKKQAIPVIATLRSWDNLVTKGTLRFQPDVLLSHSSYMTDLATRVHGIDPTSIIQSVTPSYQKQFLPDQSITKEKHLKITYGCIGPILNPDEINFISWLASVSTKVEATITIVQHPKFSHNLNEIDTGRLVFKTFDYLSTTLHDYYDFIAQQNLVIASGTSFALDTMFARTQLVGLAFEIIKQEYWLSHLRSYDILPHSKFLFDEFSIKKVHSKLELIEIINGNGLWQNNLSDEDSLQALTGDSNIKLDEQILNIINQGSF
jgi:hypothetical protein